MSALHQKRLPRILILGGTTEGAELASRLTRREDLSVISSLAGRVSNPKLPEGVVRIGGFGGVTGLMDYLANEEITMVVDATHPFAAKISHNAQTACASLGIEFIVFSRPQWEKSGEDLWHEFDNFRDAAAFVDLRECRVLLTIGRQEVSSFAACKDAWFLIRSIEEPAEPLPAHHEILLRRGPFKLNDEMRLLKEQSIDYIVSKNSGGQATYAKIVAARLLRIPVVMVRRPMKHAGATLGTVDEVTASIDRFVYGGQ